jgi:hypothetical protein
LWLEIKKHAYFFQNQKTCYFDCSDHLKPNICKVPNALAAKRVVRSLPRTNKLKFYKTLLMFQALSFKFKLIPIFCNNKLQEAFRFGLKFIILSMIIPHRISQKLHFRVCTWPKLGVQFHVLHVKIGQNGVHFWKIWCAMIKTDLTGPTEVGGCKI